ncbi:MAG TPA: DUF1847 domain-containing protein [Candidatus Acidoferrales bacterium]|nr:DUF1847 domain-containing protein [Candidatus Acidoferrales bacterium]
MSRIIDCADCGINPCEKGSGNVSFNACPMNTAKEVLENASQIYKSEIREMAHAAALVEAKGYMKWTRVEDTMEFARVMGYKKLGIACCVGLRREGAILESILRKNGFEVCSAVCKTGGVAKETLGIKDEEKVRPGGFEAMCNPIAQAMLLDSAGCELNILVGLCVGHDSLFAKASKAPVTTLVAKDRVLGHNPVAAIYNHQSYYKERLYDNHVHLKT